MKSNNIEKSLITADPGHISVLLLVAKMRAGAPIVDPDEAELKRKAFLDGISKWCCEHYIDIRWTATPGRRAVGREYRVGYNGLNSAEEMTELLDGLDAEIARLAAE
jgi:hypothetical protein